MHLMEPVFLLTALIAPILATLLYNLTLLHHPADLFSLQLLNCWNFSLVCG